MYEKEVARSVELNKRKLGISDIRSLKVSKLGAGENNISMLVKVDAKRFVCSQLSLIGSQESVAVLARLLGDEQLSLAARTALVRIPGNESLAALRRAVASAAGVRRIGLMTSLGERKDPMAVDGIVPHLKSKDLDVAAAALDSLGRIGSEKAVKALVESERYLRARLRPAWADAL